MCNTTAHPVLTSAQKMSPPLCEGATYSRWCPVLDFEDSDMVTTFTLFCFKPLAVLTEVSEATTIIFNGNPLGFIFALLILLYVSVVGRDVTIYSGVVES